jgi:hypothetical protein
MLILMRCIAPPKAPTFGQHFLHVELPEKSAALNSAALRGIRKSLFKR